MQIKNMKQWVTFFDKKLRLIEGYIYFYHMRKMCTELNKYKITL